MIDLLNQDCRDLLKHVDPTKIKLVMTDPPYGKNARYRLGRNVRIQGDQDQGIGQHVLDWAAQHNLPTVAFASPLKPWAGIWRQHLVWHKGGAVGMGDLKRTWKPCWELIQIARNTPLRHKRDVAVLSYPILPRDLKDHPTAKPVALLRYLIEQLTDEGDLVLDPFAGIGSTAVACQQSGRHFTGCEIDETFYKFAKERLRETVVGQREN